jgi:Flp pilus assembly protein TadG
MLTFQRQPPKSASNDSRQGSVMVFLVAAVVVVLALSVFSVDVASMQLARTELRVASDAAAKAGVEALLRTDDGPKAVQAAVAMARLNTVGGRTFALGSQDIVVGTSVQQSDGSWTFSLGGNRPNAVRVNSKMRPDSVSSPIAVSLAGFFGGGAFASAKTSTAAAVQQEICLCIDRSASMSWDLTGNDSSFPPGGESNSRPVAGSRWNALMKAIGVYLAEIRETSVPSRIALVTWSSDRSSERLPAENHLEFPPPETSAPSHVAALLESGLSYTSSPIESALQRRSEHPLYGTTNLSAGIDKGVETLTAGNVLRQTRRSIILMTDGGWDEGRNPREAAHAAHDRGILIHVVTFLSGAESADAQAIATITGGRYLHAKDEGQLVAAFRKLARILPVVLTD